MDLITLINARKIIMQHSQEKLPVSLAYKFAKFLKGTEGDEAFYNEKFLEIVNQYRQRDENGNFVESGNGIPLVASETEKCKEELKELGNTKVNLPNIRFSLHELSILKLSVQDIFVLEELFEEK
jgi:hypothetical protein